jgi:DNA polymerase type B, organellar and viral.
MNILWETHHIHLTRYLGMPSAAWAAFLRHDPTMEIPLYQSTFYAEFFKGMIRGGITSAAIREAVADDTHSIIYLDVNGLYPYVMQAYGFPCGEFRTEFMNWTGVENCRMNLERYFEVFEREKRGACFCVDMHITDELKG